MLDATPELLRFAFTLAPGAAIPGTHVHPKSEQRILVSAGALHVRVPAAHHVLRAGDAVSVPAGTPHFQWNPGSETVRAIEEYRPAGRLYAMFSTFFRLAGEGMLSARGRIRNPLLVAAFFAEFRDEVRAHPQLFQWGLDRMAPLARWLGYDERVRRSAPAEGRAGA